MSHNIKFDRYNRTEMEELQAPISDSAFYLSYFYDVARAPSLADGLVRLIWDDRSEAPDTVNALHKFNVVPEFVVASLHRLLGLVMSPYAFYVWCVVVATGVGVFALALTSALLGGSTICAIAAVVLYFSICFSPSMQAGTRLVGGTFALREFWGVPALLLQNTWLVGTLGARKRPYGYLLGYVGCTCVFEMAWQFAPFVLLLQMLSLLGAHTLASLPRCRLGEVALASVIGTLAALVLSFGNRMLLCSPFFALASSVALVGLMPGPAALVGRGGGLGEAAWVLAAALGGGAVAQQALARAASGQEDKHVLQLLMQKLGFAPPDASFDAFLYLQSPEFGFLDMQYVHEASRALALPAAGLAAALIVVAVARRRLVPMLCGRSEEAKSGKSSQAEAGGSKAQKKGGAGASKQKKDRAKQVDPEAHPDCDAPWSGWVVQLLFLIALILLAALVNRLRVLAAPVLCLTASLAASPKLWGEALCRTSPLTSLAHVFGLVMVGVPLWLTGAVERVRQVGEMQPDFDMLELVQWANQSLPAGSLFMADMTMAAKFRMISPSVRVGNHPQYESITSRQRNRAYYRTFTCAPPQRVHEVLSKYGVTHVLLNANACRARMGKLDAFHEEADRCGKLSVQQLQQRTFCWAGFLAEGPRLFELSFRNAVYTVLQLRNTSAASSSASRPKAKDLNSVATWRPWLKGLSDPSAARGLARAAARWPQMYGGFDVAEAMQGRAEELAPEDAFVVLERGELQFLAKDGKAAHESMARAAKLASKAARSVGNSSLKSSDQAYIAWRERHWDLLRVYLVWKELLGKQGASAKDNVKRLAKSLQAYLEASDNAFDLCDLAAWLGELGERQLAKQLWDAAKRISRYDQCVREDWAKWEGKEMSRDQVWKAFLRL